uniref:Uncharacterized protein n=1 Tax=Oryza nivara TaxID=4536 RepID=A0A0E0HN69_ORYNI
MPSRLASPRHGHGTNDGVGCLKSLCHSEETLLMETMTEKLKVTTSALGAQRTGVG